MNNRLEYMSKIRDDLDNILVKIETVENLAEFIEDFFEKTYCHKEFNKNGTLSTIMVEKIKSLNEEVNTLYAKTFVLEQEK